jgi:hypothetical protein
MTDISRIREIVSGTLYPNKEVVMDEADEDDLDSELDDLESDVDADLEADATDDVEDTDLDVDGEEGLEDDDFGDDMGGPDDFGAPSDFGGDFGSDSEEPESEPEVEEPVEEPIPEVEDTQNDVEKINELFTDTGDMAFDYGLENPANIRLAKFKFKNAGIDILTLLTPDELSVGVPSKDLEDRLSPEQKEQYIISNRKLRDEFPQLAAREKNILIYNSNIPMVKNDATGNEQALIDEDLNKSYEKVDEYMSKRFGEYWQEKRASSDFLQTIKINFSDKESIRPNLITADNFEPVEGLDIPPLPFNKVTVPIPNSIDTFIRTNLENPDFLRSSIFSSLSSAYKSGSGRGNDVYVIINGEDETSEEIPEEPVEDDSIEDEEPVEDDETIEEPDKSGEEDEEADIDEELPELEL